MEHDAILIAASEDRIRLIAKKFESGLNPEELARLEVLTATINRLAPRVTARDARVLEQIAERIEARKVKIDSLAQLGLGR